MMNHLIRTPKQLSKVTNRLLLGLCISDALFTFFVAFMTTWMVPRDLHNAWGEEIDVVMNVGNIHTCTMQGFLDHLGSKMSWVYNAELAVAYLIAIRYRKGERYLVKFEPLLHATAITFGLTTAIIPLPYDAYNFSRGAYCWLAPSPTGCTLVKPGDGGQTCQRGRNFETLRTWLGRIPLCVTQIIVLFSMVGLFFTVYCLERKGDRYCSTSRRRKTKTVALKSALYAAAFEVTWIWYIVAVVVSYFSDGYGDNIEKNGFPTDSRGWTMYILHMIFFPSYGFWSAIVYFILPFLKVRKDRPELGLFDQIKKTVLPPAKIDNKTKWNKRLPCFRMSYRKKNHVENEGILEPEFVTNDLADEGITPSIVPFERTYYEDEDNFAHDEESDEEENNM